MTPQLSAYGDHALLLQWPSTEFSLEISDRIHDLSARLRESGDFTDVVPGYDSLLCVFDLGRHSMSFIESQVKAQLAKKSAKPKPNSKTIDIPVHYGGPDGPDMAVICKASGLSETEVIKRHSAEAYQVCMMGFIPGFTFLSPAPKSLHHPRLETPRAKVPAGSIGIANWQTGIYGLESPGGWQIIGRTPLSIFDANRKAPFLLKAGDQIRFMPQ